MPRVVVPPPYRGPTGGREEIDVEGASVRECLHAVERRFPGFGPQVLDAGGRLHRFVSLFVNGEELDRAALDAAVAPGDRLEILAAIGGGA